MCVCDLTTPLLSQVMAADKWRQAPSALSQGSHVLPFLTVNFFFFLGLILWCKCTLSPRKIYIYPKRRASPLASRAVKYVVKAANVAAVQPHSQWGKKKGEERGHKSIIRYTNTKMHIILDRRGENTLWVLPAIKGGKWKKERGREFRK